jgi:hypothetical protein
VLVGVPLVSSVGSVVDCGDRGAKIEVPKNKNPSAMTIASATAILVEVTFIGL